MGRAKILLIFILVLALGVSFFMGEYFANAEKWVHKPNSPHVYHAENIACGTITDRNGILLADLTDGRTYSENVALRSGTLHWIGDRLGNISSPALSYFAQHIAGFDAVNGLYAYGGTGGTVRTTFSARVQIVAQEAMAGYTGTVAVYNYKTGELVCCVSTPNFDPDNVPDIASNPAYDGVYLNRFTQVSYTPGSIFKIVTAAAALEEIPDIIERTYTCNGVLEFGSDKVTFYSGVSYRNLLILHGKEFSAKVLPFSFFTARKRPYVIVSLIFCVKFTMRTLPWISSILTASS